MQAVEIVKTVASEWATMLGAQFDIGDDVPGRDLWPVTAEDGRQYFLKRLGPWRNLPLADEARVLRHLSAQGMSVAEFLPTDHARLYAGQIEESFVLFPRLASDQFDVAEILSMEEGIGSTVAALHMALDCYPWSVNSYVENLAGALESDLLLPPDIAGNVGVHRERVVSALASLPTQLVHGDLTPENILLKRPGSVSGFIDFDHLPLAPRIWDLAKYLSRRLRMRWQQGVPVSVEDRVTHISPFLTGYQQASPLEMAEIDTLPDLILAANVIEASYFQEISSGRLVRRMLSDHEEVLADTIEAIRWHLAHVDEVAAAVQTSFTSVPPS